MSSEALIEAKQEDGEVVHRGWKTMPYLIGAGACEKLGTDGASANMLVYLTTVFHLSSVEATTLINVWSGTANILTIAGAFLSDAYIGRYAMIGFSSVISFLGLTAIAITAGVGTLHPSLCNGDAAACRGPTPWQLAFFLSALGLLVVGAGGIRPCIASFGPDQFDARTASGRKGINSFFNINFATTIAAEMISSTAIVYVQSNISWTVGLAIPAVLMLLSCIFFFSGSSIFLKIPPEGSPFTGVARVIVAAARNRRREVLSSKSSAAAFFNPPPTGPAINARLPRTQQFRFLEKAAIITTSDELDAESASPVNARRLCSLQQVEEVKCLMRIVPVWWAGNIYCLSAAQHRTFSALQALQCDRHLGGTNFVIPAASFYFSSMISFILSIIFYERTVKPWLRRKTGKEGGLTLLQRIGAGLSISIVATLMAAIVEKKRKKEGSAAPISAFWLVPQLGISGLSEIFAIVGLGEFFYHQVPENMRSIGGSLVYLNIAAGSYLGSFLLTTVHRVSGWLTDDLNHGNLDYFYLLIAGLEAMNFLYFLAISRWYRYKDLGGSIQED